MSATSPEESYPDNPIDSLVSEVNEGLKEAFSALKEVKEIREKERQKRIEAVKHMEKPSSWKEGTVAPYYREKFALEIKNVLDEMIADVAVDPNKADRMFRYDVFTKLSGHSLYIKIHQSVSYLIDKLDTPDGKYRKFRALIDIKREPGIGVRIAYMPAKNTREETPLTAADKIDTKKNRVQPIIWKQKIEDFFEQSEPGKVLHIKKLTLTEEEQQYVKDMLAGIDHYLFRVNSSEIKILHFDPENPPI